MTHIVFDSYNELSIKDGERNRIAGEDIAVDLAVVDESVTIPHQLDKSSGHQVSTNRTFSYWPGMWRNGICMTWY